MTNIGKRRYEEIPIPDDLEWIVARACRRSSYRRIVKKWLTGFAAVFTLLLICANITPLYASAAEVPILGQMVRVLRIGSGGHATDDVFVTAKATTTGVEISFHTKGGKDSQVPVYSVTRRTAPFRMILRLHGIESMDTESLLTAFSSLDAVADVYLNAYTTAGDQGITVVLNRDCEFSVEENDSPGTLVVDFYDGESDQNATSYFLCSEAMPLGEELADLTQQFSWEGATQVKTAAGEYRVVLGNYRTEEQAREAKAGIEEKFGKSLGLSVAHGGTYEIPEN